MYPDDSRRIFQTLPMGVNGAIDSTEAKRPLVAS